MGGDSMRSKKIDNNRTKKGIVRNIAFAGVMAAGIMLGCSRTEPAIPQQVPVVAIQENVSATKNSTPEIEEGERYSFNRTKEAPFAFKVIELNEETATLEFDLGTVTPSVNIISQSFRFSGVKVQRDKVNDIMKRMWNESGNPLSKRDLMVVDVENNNPADSEGTPDNGLASLDQTNAEPVRRAIEALAYLVDGTKATSIRILESDAESYLVETSSSQAKRRFRLQKKMGLNVEFLNEKAGYMSMDFTIKQLSTGADGKLVAELGPDCEGRINMEIFMSESASGGLGILIEGCR